MNKDFLSWLGHADNNTCTIEEAGMTYHFARVQKNEFFEYLYCQRQYSEKELTRGGAFKYVGIFCRKDGELYDAQYDLKSLDHELGTMADKSAGVLSEQLQAAVRQRVEAAIGNDRRNLKISELTDSALLKRLDYARQYGAKENARKRYMDMEEFQPPVYRCAYDPDHWTEDSLLDYILDPQGYASKEAAAYIENNQEEMLFDFLCSDMELAEYQALVVDTNNPVHIVKKIMAAMNTTPAKTVNVTILKNGEEFTFKTEAQELRRDCKNYYSSWNMVAADRRKFEELFGRSADYTPQEILRITYARAVLYEAGQ